MDNLTTLLVAFMFITILTLGIAGILSELAEAVRHAHAEPRDGLLLGWSLLLLFAYFDLFWHTGDIGLVRNWGFPLFLFAEMGPVLLLFATQIVVGASSESGGKPSQLLLTQSHFFLLFALVQLWAIVAGFLIGTGFTLASGISLAIAAICLALAMTDRRTPHVLGLAAIALLYVAAAALES